jgi:hypothetical protein
MLRAMLRYRGCSSCNTKTTPLSKPGQKNNFKVRIIYEIGICKWLALNKYFRVEGRTRQGWLKVTKEEYHNTDKDKVN